MDNSKTHKRLDDMLAFAQALTSEIVSLKKEMLIEQPPKKRKERNAELKAKFSRQHAEHFAKLDAKAKERYKI